MIELLSIEEQQLSKLAGLAVNPQAQRVGYSDKSQYKIERDLSLAVIKGKSDILWLSERYAKSYDLTKTPTVNQYKDYICSLCLLEFAKDTQYYIKGRNLTKHAVNVWSKYDYRKIWPYIADNTDVPTLYAWGPLGSLSFYTYYLPNRDSYNEDTWLTQVIECLRLFWLSLGQPFDITEDITVINRRLQSLLNTLGITDDFVLRAEELFDVTYKDTLLERRRRGQSSAEINQLKQRMLYGEYPQDIYQDALSRAPDRLKEDFQRINDKLLAIAKPGGIRMVMQAIILETLCRSVLLITELDSLWKDQLLVAYNRPDAYLSFGAGDVRRKLLQHWIVMSDAKHLQHLFNDPPVAYKESKDIVLWKSSVLDLDTSLSAPYRLTALL